MKLLLEQLVASGSAERRRDVLGSLYCAVANQGSLYTAAVPCVDLLADVLAAGGAVNAECISLLEMILNSRTPGLTVEVDGVPVDAAGYCRERVLGVLPRILAAVDAQGGEYLREVCLLIPQLADSSPLVLDFLRGVVAGHEGELSECIADATEEAEEVERDGPMG